MSRYRVSLIPAGRHLIASSEDAAIRIATDYTGADRLDVADSVALLSELVPKVTISYAHDPTRAVRLELCHDHPPTRRLTPR